MPESARARPWGPLVPLQGIKEMCHGLTWILIQFYWRRNWQPTPVFLPGEFHGQRSREGYSPWDCKESDTTERLSNNNNNSLIRL